MLLALENSKQTLLQPVQIEQRSREFSWIWLSRAELHWLFLSLPSPLPWAPTRLSDTVYVCVCVCVCLRFSLRRILGMGTRDFPCSSDCSFFGLFFPLFTQSPSTTPLPPPSPLCYLCFDSSIHSFYPRSLWWGGVCVWKSEKFWAKVTVVEPESL